MTLPLWGELEKAQDDSETIEEAIAAAITAHNDASNAHIGAGKSLDSHKTEEVIDHPAGSLLADKATMTELAVHTIFESIDGWSTVGEVDNTDLPGLQIYIEYGAVDESGITSQPQVPLNFLNSSKNMLFQILMHRDFSNSHYDAVFGFFSSYSTTSSGFGFVIEEGVMYGHAKSGSSQNRTASIYVDPYLDHIFRVYLDADTETIYFFVDGVQRGSVSIPGSGWSDDTGPTLWAEATDTNDGSLFVGNLYFSREI